MIADLSLGYRPAWSLALFHGIDLGL